MDIYAKVEKREALKDQIHDLNHQVRSVEREIKTDLIERQDVDYLKIDWNMVKKMYYMMQPIQD